MRRVDRTHTIKPIELDANACQIHLAAIINTPSQTKVSADFYKGKKVNADGSVEFTVRDSLKVLYKNKCSYCEKSSHAPKIDHHRPKGKVVGGGNLNYGYYWLSYEWTNLLPSCTDCNAIDSKGSKYPINGNRNNSHPLQGNPPTLHGLSLIYDSPFNVAEHPLLLHPEYSIPENNFAFDKQGRIIGITAEGVNTILALKLDNADLNGWRRKIYNEHLSSFHSIIRKFFRANDPISEPQFAEMISDWTKKIVNEAQDDTLEYTLFRKYILTNIDYFFVSELDTVFRDEAKNKIAEALVNI
jgi:hypothetical protein